MAEKSQLPRMSWVGLYFLCGITAGIYTLFWFANVLKGMNKLNNTPDNGKTLFKIFIGSYVIGIITYIIGTISTTGSVTLTMMSDPTTLYSSAPVDPSISPLMIIGYLLLLLAGVIMLIFSFQFRSILIKKCNLRVGGFWTLLFNVLNIQYAINRAYRNGSLKQDSTTATLI